MKLVNVVAIFVVLLAPVSVVHAQTNVYFNPNDSAASWEDAVWNSVGCGTQPSGAGPRFL